MNHGFVKVAAAVPKVSVANCRFNIKQIESLMAVADGKGVQIIVFPELCVTGYTCADLFAGQLLLEEAEAALMQVLNNMRRFNIIAVLGMPVVVNSMIANAAVVIQRGKILGVVPKTYLPNYKEFYEQRWFTAAPAIKESEVRLCAQTVPLSSNLLFETSDVTFGIEICEDLWAVIPPSSYLALQGAEIIFNLSADNECVGKQNYLRSLISRQSSACMAGYVFSSCGSGESSTDLVFAGGGLIYENGNLLSQSERFCLKEQLVIGEIDVEKLRAERRINTTFSANRAICPTPAPMRVVTEYIERKDLELTRPFNPHPFLPSPEETDERCREILAIQTAGLAQRLLHTGAQHVVIGISGGLDSTLALLVCTKTFDKLSLPRKNIIGITMPGFGTSGRTAGNALQLMKSLGITGREISIKEACLQHFKDIGHSVDVHNVTYENAQARERTQILMDVANQVNGPVIGTGDLSEFVLGWTTYAGDHISMYGVNASVPKTLVKHVTRWAADNETNETLKAVLLDVIDTPVSPELIPTDEHGNISQETESIVGPYELHDFFIYHFFLFGFRPSKIYFLACRAFKGKYDEEAVKQRLHFFFRRLFANQFKRSCFPDGPKVCNVSVSPRGDWRMPSDAVATAWLQEIEGL